MSNQERSAKLLNVIGVFLLAWALYSIYAAIVVFLDLGKHNQLQFDDPSNFIFIILLIKMVSFIVLYIFGGIGLLYRKNFGWIIALAICVLTVITRSMFVWDRIETGRVDPSVWMQGTGMILCAISAGLLLVKSIRDHFKLALFDYIIAVGIIVINLSF
ncbi:MAG: hypothetical protein BM555_00955 [Crocinitomix sp. MedPE-SWsnd]|nr:MAG: hypothetical protein BM555_00955 [Crocinitomix sp. MedPE-SWsnd]